MHLALLAASALGSLPLVVQPQDALSDVRWPSHAVIAAPVGSIKPADHLFVLQDNRPVVAQVETVARWPDGSAKWLHAYASFQYTNGKPAKYALSVDSKPLENVPKSPLVITDDAGGIHIDTGAVSLLIPRPFSGITSARFGGATVLDGTGGPSLVDERGIEWHARYDDKAEIIIEQQGAAQATIKASGWYQSAERRVEPFCRFVTRISVFAGSPIVKFDHATIFADDMRKHAIAEAGFKFALAGAKKFSSGTLAGGFRNDVSAAWIAQLSADRQASMLQRGPEGRQTPKPTFTKDRSPGWFSAEVSSGRVALLTKDFWQKYPKEVKIAPDEITYYAWPKHGDLATPDETATQPEGIYKFQCFLTGKLLDSRLPNEYFAALAAQRETTECKAEYARAANLEGVAMHNEFALAFLPAASARTDPRYLEHLEQLYVQSPIATVGPAAFAASGAFGTVAPTGPEFPEVQQAVRDGMLGYMHSIERYGDYGWCIYGNGHNEELMNPATAGVPGGRPSLHRVWKNHADHQVSTLWRLFALDGDLRLLDGARKCTDNHASIGQVRYDNARGHLDGQGQLQNGPEVKGHIPGSFWHGKAFVPWGGRDYGMDRNDADSRLFGRSADPSGLLFAWLLDANRWAKDGYELWLANVQFPTGGNRREVNTSLVHAITAYEYQPKSETLAAIKGMAAGLISEPLLQQYPGPLWEPTWLSRYHELFPDDEAFNKYILTSADSCGVHAGGIWSLALCATAYRMTKNEEYLRRHAGTLARAVRDVFHDEAPDKRWDRYGFGPGPGRDEHFMLQWHRFSAALRDAKITSLPAPSEPGTYFSSSANLDSRDSIAARGIKILVWRESQSSDLVLQAAPIPGGDMHPASLRLLSPKKHSLLDISPLAVSTESASRERFCRASTWDAYVESHPFPSGEPGLYTLLLGSYRIGVFQGLTKHPECQVLRSSKLHDAPEPCVLAAQLTRGYLVPLTTGKIRLTFSASGERDGSFVSLRDLQGKNIVTRYLRAGDSVSVAINEAGGLQGPGLLDVFSDHTGFVKLTISSSTTEPLLYGRRLEDVQLIRQKLGK